MRFVKIVLVLLVFASCKTNKVITDSGSVKNLSAKKIVKNHLSNDFNAQTLDSKIRVQYSNQVGSEKKRHSFTVRMRMKKDSVIWFRGKKSVVSVFKMKITPESFSFYSLIDKVYFEGDFSQLKKVLGVEISFSQLQNLLIGKSIFDMKGKRFQTEIKDASYQLTPKVQEKLFDVFFKINPDHFRLNQLYLVNEEKNQRLRIDYQDYTKLEGDIVPVRMMIDASQGDRYTYINMKYSSLTLNKPVSVPYKIPSGYKRIDL